LREDGIVLPSEDENDVRDIDEDSGVFSQGEDEEDGFLVR
jgi:hypothetical protein